MPLLSGAPCAVMSLIINHLCQLHPALVHIITLTHHYTPFIYEMESTHCELAMREPRQRRTEEQASDVLILLLISIYSELRIHKQNSYKTQHQCRKLDIDDKYMHLRNTIAIAFQIETKLVVLPALPQAFLVVKFPMSNT